MNHHATARLAEACSRGPGHARLREHRRGLGRHRVRQEQGGGGGGHPARWERRDSPSPSSASRCSTGPTGTATWSACSRPSGPGATGPSAIRPRRRAASSSTTRRRRPGPRRGAGPGRHLRRRTRGAPTLGEIHAAAYAAVGRRSPRVTIPRGAALAAARALQAGAGLAGRSTRLPDQIETLTAPAGFDGAPFARATGFAPEVGLAGRDAPAPPAGWRAQDGVTPVLVAAACALASALLVRAVRDFANRRALLDRPNDRSSHDDPEAAAGRGRGGGARCSPSGAWLVVARAARPSRSSSRSPPPALVALLGLADDLRPLPGPGPLRRPGAAGVARGRRVLEPAPRRGRRARRVAPGARPGGARRALDRLAHQPLQLHGRHRRASPARRRSSPRSASPPSPPGVGAGTTAWLLLALAGSSLGFLLFNFPPSSIFMGDVGSTAIGFFFGVLPLLPEARPVPFEPVALALSLFVLDATVTLLRRVARGEKWYTPHRTHLYQRPVVLGAGHRAVLLRGRRRHGGGVGVCGGVGPGARGGAVRARWPCRSRSSSRAVSRFGGWNVVQSQRGIPRDEAATPVRGCSKLAGFMKKGNIAKWRT